MRLGEVRLGEVDRRVRCSNELKAHGKYQTRGY